jgi:hypothetical protein
MIGWACAAIERLGARGSARWMERPGARDGFLIIPHARRGPVKEGQNAERLSNLRVSLGFVCYLRTPP